MSCEDTLDLAVQKVIAGIKDEEVEARYPNRSHFIAADHPEHGAMATRALGEGDPVVLVFPDGYELLIQTGESGAFRIQARDATGQPIAA